MKFEINTDKLKRMVNKSVKCCSNMSNFPLTSLIEINLADDGKLTLTTTDCNNYLYVSEQLDIFKCDITNPTISVNAEHFSKLISKMTCDTITINLTNTKLQVIGNGVYYIDLPLDDVEDENGDCKYIKFPSNKETISNIMSNENTFSNKMTLDTIHTILSTCKNSLAVTLEMPCYTNYYMSDKIITTDSYKMCVFNKSLFNSPILVSANTMNLLDVVEDDVTVFVKDNDIIFKADKFIVLGKLAEGIGDFAVDSIQTLINLDFENNCQIAKSELLSALDRVSLFINSYDENAIWLKFDNTKHTLYINDVGDKCKENLKYISNNNSNSNDFECKIDINMLISQIKSQQSEIVNLYFGQPNVIKLVDDDCNCISVIALLAN